MSKTVTPAPVDPAEVYGAALDRMEAVRRMPGADEPGRETVTANEAGDYYERLTPSPLDIAAKELHEARSALRAQAGPSAVRLAEAQFELRRTEMKLAELQASPLAVGAGSQIAALLGQQRAAQGVVDSLLPVVQRDVQRAAERERLEADSAPLLAELNQQLAEARARLAQAAYAAQTALTELHAEAATWREATQAARARLVAAGFDGQARFDGSSYPTSLDSDLTVAGSTWFAPQPVAVVARVMYNVAKATGERGRLLSGALLRQSGGSARQVDALLADVPAPVVDSEPVASTSMPALKDWAPLPEVVKSGGRDGYFPADKPRPRRLGILRGR